MSLRRLAILSLLSLVVTALLCEKGESATGSLAVTATVLTKSNCRFNTTAATLAFGTLDPANPVVKTATASLVYRCGGSAPVATYLITDDDGANETGLNANRMLHTALPGNYIPYQLTYTPASASIPRNVNQNLSVTATILGPSYQTALSGDYSDTVILQIDP